MVKLTAVLVTIQNQPSSPFPGTITHLLHNISNRDKYCKTDFPQETTSWPVFAGPDFACANTLEFQVQAPTPSINTHTHKKRSLFLEERYQRKLRKKQTSLAYSQLLQDLVCRGQQGKRRETISLADPQHLQSKWHIQQDEKTQKSTWIEKRINSSFCVCLILSLALGSNSEV